MKVLNILIEIFLIIEGNHSKNILLMEQFLLEKRAIFTTKTFFGARSIAYIMNQIDSIDIDTELDYELACICMKKRKNI